MLLAPVLISLTTSPPRTLGKTDAQILQMGQHDWCDFYIEKKGESKMSDVESRYLYGDAIGRCSARLLANPNFPHRLKAKRLAGLIVHFGETCSELGDTLDPNTGWSWVASRLYADSQDAVYGYLHPQGRSRPKPMHVSNVTRPLAEAASLLSNTRDESNGFDSHPEQARTLYADLKTTFNQIVPLIAATTGRTGSDRILTYCLEAVSAISY